MTIDIGGDMVGWMIAIGIWVLVLLAIFTLTALRFAIGYLMKEISTLKKRIPGGEGGGGGSPLDMLGMLGGMFGGKK